MFSISLLQQLLNLSPIVTYIVDVLLSLPRPNIMLSEHLSSRRLFIVFILFASVVLESNADENIVQLTRFEIESNRANRWAE